MATHGGAADSYYNDGQPQMQQPPNYSQNPQYATGNGVAGDKQDFSQAFKLDKPKYNDIWAGVLVCVISRRVL